MASPVSRSLSADNGRKMVADIANRQTLFWVMIALLVHLVLVGATSIGYIRDRWIDPAGAAARTQAAQATENTRPEETLSTGTNATPPAAQPQTSAPTPPEEEKKLLDRQKDNAEVKSITQKEKPNEIPKTPTHDGFNLDDSSLK